MTSGWTFDAEQVLGKGGFGRVYSATSPAGEQVAAKVVPKAPGASRELLGEGLPPSPHLVPILFVDETPDAYVLYMPRAERSLRDRMFEEVASAEALDILRQIALGLRELAGHVVHRDLKPENVLLVEGRWAICDFGIARYVDASTDTDTHKWSMSAPYAAPEQWRHERATGATDMYALGVIAHELLAGTRPFPGPTRELYRAQHLEVPPPRLIATKRLSSLVDECLYKAPEARPTVENFLTRIERAEADAATPGATALAEAQRLLVSERAASQAAAEAERTEAERRTMLEGAAMSMFEGIREELIEQITDAAPGVAVRRTPAGVELGIRNATLWIKTPQPVSRRGDQFDVIAHGVIGIRSSAQGLSRSHSLYYGDIATAGSYQWFEVGYCGAFGADFENQPVALAPHEADEAFRPMIGRMQLAYGPNPLTVGDLDEFIDAWARRFGQAAVDAYPRVSQLPEPGAVRRLGRR